MDTEGMIRMRRVDVHDLREELDEFERRYGRDSSELAGAFRDEDGRLEESEDLFRWAQVYAAWRSATGRSG